MQLIQNRSLEETQIENANPNLKTKPEINKYALIRTVASLSREKRLEISKRLGCTHSCIFEEILTDPQYDLDQASKVMGDVCSDFEKFRCGQPIEYYFKGEKHTQQVSQELTPWFQALSIPSELYIRMLEIIQVLETGRGSVRGVIKDIVKRISKIGFVDDIKSRGALQMRSNFVVAKILKDFVTSQQKNENPEVTDLKSRLLGYTGFCEYVGMSKSQEITLNDKISDIQNMETFLDESKLEYMISSLKELINLNIRKQLKRNKQDWSICEIIETLTTKPYWRDYFRDFEFVDWQVIDRKLDSLESIERICRIICVITESRNPFLKTNLFVEDEYLERKREVFAMIKPRDRAVDDIKQILEKENGVSVWVAYQMISQNLLILDNLALANDETFDAANNWIAMRMLLSSYNRGINKITLTVVQNWILQFSKLFCDPNQNSKMLGERDVDSTFKTAKKRELIFEKMQHSLLQIFNFMQQQGLLPKEFRMLDFLDCIRLISRSETRIEFIKHPLIRFLKQYFEQTTGTNLSVILSEEQMQSYYFSYGGKVLRSQNDFGTFKS